MCAWTFAENYAALLMCLEAHVIYQSLLSSVSFLFCVIFRLIGVIQPLSEHSCSENAVFFINHVFKKSEVEVDVHLSKTT